MVENVIIVNDFGYVDGGASKIAIETAITLANKGIDVIYFCAVGPIDSLLFHDKIKVICLEQQDLINDNNKLRAIMQGVLNLKCKFEFTKLLNTVDKYKTVVHIHTWTKGLSGVIFYCCRKSGIKSVLTLHDYFSICPNGGLFNYKKCRICNYKALSIKCITSNCDSRNYIFKVYRLIRYIIQNKIYKLNEAITTKIYVSKFSKNIFSIRNDDYNGSIVPNPINIIQNKKVDIEKNKTILYLGRLDKEKGVLLLAKAAKEINFKIIFIGDGKCKEEIKDINQKAFITGWVSKENLHEYLNQGKILVAPSLLHETMGISPLESIQCGIPVIVSDEYAATEYIEEGKSGYIFKTNDIEDLKNKIRKIFNEIDNGKFRDVKISSDYKMLDNNKYFTEIIKIYNELL